MTPTQEMIVKKIREHNEWERGEIKSTITREEFTDNNDCVTWFFEVKTENPNSVLGSEPRYMQHSYSIGKRGSHEHQTRFNEVYLWGDKETRHGTKDNIRLS